MLDSAAAASRHPDDPDPVRSSKAVAALLLASVAVPTAALVIGLAPATIALLLAGQARRETFDAGGYLTGAALLTWTERLAWLAVVVAAVASAALLIAWVLWGAGGRDFPAEVQ
ncbi:hypothetical protein [Pilimelia columellifera]|uniref:Uncharacterized protein n=1 Tax=Pilimelia columellifera subsp. columellifera TaxID=706583 RepID=A0ABN3NDX9_9ACTN